MRRFEHAFRHVRYTPRRMLQNPGAFYGSTGFEHSEPVVTPTVPSGGAID